MQKKKKSKEKREGVRCICTLFCWDLNDGEPARAPPTDDARTAAHSVHTLATRQGHAHSAGAALTQAAAATARPEASCDESEGPCRRNRRDQPARSPRERRERSLRVATRAAMRAAGDSSDWLPAAHHDAPCGRTRSPCPPAQRSGSSAALKAAQSDLQPGLPGERACEPARQRTGSPREPAIGGCACQPTRQPTGSTIDRSP